MRRTLPLCARGQALNLGGQCGEIRRGRWARLLLLLLLLRLLDR